MEVCSSPRGTLTKGEPHGESTSYFTIDEDNTDHVSHATLIPEIYAAV